MPLDRGVIDLLWKVCHGALLTVDRLISFGYDYPPACFCGHPLETAEHLFFHCPLAKSGVDWVQSLLFCVVTAAPSILLRHVLFGFAHDELAAVPRVFVYLPIYVHVSLISKYEIVSSMSELSKYRLEGASVVLFLANSLVNPILHAIRMPEYRLAVLALFRRRPQQQREAEVLPLHNL